MMTFFVKTFLFLTLSLYGSFSLATEFSDIDIDSIVVSGVPYSKKLKVTIHKACIGPFSRNLSPGPYKIKVSVFNATFDKTNASVSSTHLRDISDAQFNFADYETEETVSANTTVERLKATMGLPLPGQQFKFSNFEFIIPFEEIHESIFDLPSISETGFFDNLLLSDERREQIIKILGIEISIQDSFTNVVTNKTKIAFPTPADHLGDNLIEDIWKGDEATLFKLWPYYAVLTNSSRSAYVTSNKHAGNEDNEESCQNKDHLSLKVDIID